MNQYKFLTELELSELKDALKQDRERFPRNAALLELMLKTGARPQEALNIQPQDLNSEFNTVFIKGLKGSKDREIPIKQDLFIRIKLLIPFNIKYSMLDTVWNRYKPQNKSLKCLRHTFAIELFKKHRDLRLVQLALGHKNISNTMIYADYVYSREEMKKVLAI